MKTTINLYLSISSWTENIKVLEIMKDQNNNHLNIIYSAIENYNQEIQNQ